MIKIDWDRIIKDRMWFGWYWIGDEVWNDDGTNLPTPNWTRSPYWVDKLWPVRTVENLYPDWWYKLTGWQKL